MPRRDGEIYMLDIKHMDAASRNQRLRETLEGMGLYVLPIFSESDSLRIDYLHVSAQLPSQDGIAQHATSRPIAAPVAGSNIAGNVGTVETSGDNVVDFPPICRQ